MILFKRDLKRALCFALLSIYFVGARAAGDASTVAKQNACLGCHAVDKKIVGPSFQSVAKKYANDRNANLFLKNKILKGGSGSWGVVPMPANTKLSSGDIALLTSWILRGAPSEIKMQE